MQMPTAEVVGFGSWDGNARFLGWGCGWDKYGAGEISTPSRDADNLQAAPTR